MSCKDNIFLSLGQIWPAISWHLHMCSCSWNQWCLCLSPGDAVLPQVPLCISSEIQSTYKPNWCPAALNLHQTIRMLPNKYFSLGLNVNFCVWVTYEHILFNFQQRENIIVKTLCGYSPLTFWMNDLCSISTQFRCNLYGEAMTDALCVYYSKLVSIRIECLAHNLADCLQSASEGAIKGSKKAEKALRSA